MRTSLKKVSILVASFGFLAVSKVFAQSLPTSSQIVFTNFTGTYHLSRDAGNHSLLTSEEAIIADFPGQGNFSGITRAIPETYQNQSVNVKVLNVNDAAGQPIPFKTAPDKNKNIVVTTGDPAITLYGIQTIKINYQTRNVVNLNTAQNEFLLDVNGRDWDTSFQKVAAVIHIPSSFASSLTAKPTCSIVFQNTTSDKCTIDTKASSEETVITSKSQEVVPAHHALVIKLQFKPATFSKQRSFWENNHKLLLICGSAAVFVLAVLYYTKHSRKKKKSTS